MTQKAFDITCPFEKCNSAPYFASDSRGLYGCW
jgi:hypothetical protein